MSVTWDERLITRQRAADMCGTWPLKMDYQTPGTTSGGVAYLRCGQCSGNVIRLPGPGKIVDIDGLISATVRHMTMNHGYSLSGAQDG